MKKKVLSLLLTLCLVMTFVPMAAFAAEANKISITTVDELLQFAKAVDNGEYDDKTDAVVSLDADLDLTGVAWTPIGSVFAADGTLQHLSKEKMVVPINLVCPFRRTNGRKFCFAIVGCDSKSKATIKRPTEGKICGLSVHGRKCSKRKMPPEH